VAIDRTLNFAFAETHEKVARQVARDFPRNLAAAVRSEVHTVLTDDDTRFTESSDNTSTPEEIGARKLYSDRRTSCGIQYFTPCSFSRLRPVRLAVAGVRGFARPLPGPSPLDVVSSRI
jgi:hypothetical protein